MKATIRVSMRRCHWSWGPAGANVLTANGGAVLNGTGVLEFDSA